MAKRTAVIEKSDSFLKVVLIHASGPRMTVTRVFKTEIDSQSVIGEILATAHLSYDDMILVIPRSNVIVKQLDLPTTDLKEINGIIDIMVGRLTPFPREEVVYGFEAVPVKGGSNSKVLVGIVQTAVINTLVSQFRGGSVPVQRIVFGSECFAALAPVIAERLGTGTFAVLDFNFDSSDFCVIAGSRLLFTKLVHFGIRDMGHSHWEDRFEEELEAVFSEFKVQNLKIEFSKIMLFNLLQEQAEIFKGILNRRAQLVASLAEESLVRIPLAGSSQQGVAEAQTQGISFSKLFAAAKYGARTAIDFSPAHVKQERAVGVQRKEFSRIFSLFIAVIAVALLILGSKVYVSELQLKSLNGQIAVLETQAAPLLSMLKRIRLIDDSRARSRSVMRSVQDVLRQVPSGMYLSEVTYIRDSVLSVRGTSRDNAKIFLFVESLKKEPLFRDVQVKYVTKRKDINDFEVLCLLAVPAK